LQSKWEVHGIPWKPEATGRMDGEQQRQQVAALYVSSHEGVVRYLVAAGFSAHTAEESAQEAFLRLYSALRDGDQIRQPKFWVYKVARHIAINAARRGVPQSAFSDTLAATVASPDLNAEQQLIEKELAAGFREAMSHLSERQRLCLELRAQGFKFSEIAEVLGIRISTAAEFIRRGIVELKKELKKCNRGTR
jgi:RNA polymerase sigma-70 factor (ECF subfamily)